MSSPYFLVTSGPTGSGKSSLIDKSIKYLGLIKPLDKNIFIIDNLIESSFYYQNKAKKIINEYFTENEKKNKNKLKNKIYNLLETPPNSSKNIFKNFSNTYFNTRKSKCNNGKACNSIIDNNIENAIKNKESIILETTGRSFPTIIEWPTDDYQLYVSYSLVEFCTLIDRNIMRTIEQIKEFLDKENGSAPRLPDIRLPVFEKVVQNILEKIVKLIEDCGQNGCITTTNKGFKKSGRKFRLIIFDNTIKSDIPIFDSENKNINFVQISNNLVNKYKASNKCSIH